MRAVPPAPRQPAAGPIWPAAWALALCCAGCSSPANETAPPAPVEAPPIAPEAAPKPAPSGPSLLAASDATVWGLAVPVGCRAHAHWRDWQDLRCTASFSEVERFFLHRYPGGRLVRSGRGARFDPGVARAGYLRLQRLRGEAGVRLMLFQGTAR